jgi:hypothetical protein
VREGARGAGQRVHTCMRVRVCVSLCVHVCVCVRVCGGVCVCICLLPFLTF